MDEQLSTVGVEIVDFDSELPEYQLSGSSCPGTRNFDPVSEHVLASQDSLRPI